MSDSVLLQHPHDPYWDGFLTRREAQRMVNKLSSNDSELMGMCDTAALVLNFLCEAKLKVDREEIEVYVEAKKLQMAEARAKMKAEAEAQKNEQPNG
jgi:hypothetical protein